MMKERQMRRNVVSLRRKVTPPHRIEMGEGGGVEAERDDQRRTVRDPYS